MSSTHYIASAWSHLCSRGDIDSILRELLGLHALKLSQYEGEDKIQPAMHLVSWVKLILDLQRTYLQWRDRTEALGTYLVDPELLLSTILHLTHLKSSIFPRDRPIFPGYMIYRFFIAQTILSGVRAVLLQSSALGVEHESRIRTIEKAIRDAWEEEKLTSAEKFIYKVCVSTLRTVPLGDLELPACGRGDFNLPKYTTGLYVSFELEGPLSDLIAAIGTLGLSESTNIKSIKNFWTLFDVIWAIEAAFIEDSIQYLGNDAQQESGLQATDTLEICPTRQISTPLMRRKILSKCAVSVDFEEKSQNLMATYPLGATLLGWCNPKLSFQDKDLILADLDAECAQFTRFLKDSLESFSNFLANRQRKLHGSDSILGMLADQRRKDLESWFERASCMSPKDIEAMKRDYCPVYIVGCPELHPLPKRLLEEKLKGDPTALEHLRNSSDIFELRIQCPRCPGEHDVRRTRIIKPLSINIDHLGTDGDFIQHHGKRTISTPRQARTPITHEIPANSNSRSPSALSIQPPGPSDCIDSPKLSLVPSSPSTTSSTKTRWKFWHSRPSPTQNSLTPPPTPFLAKPLSLFSASGSMLIVWFVNGNSLLAFDTQRIHTPAALPNKITLGNIKHVAGGTNKISIVCGNSKPQLVLRDTNNDKYQCSIDLEHSQEAQNKQIAMSRNDKFIAITRVSDKKVQLYEVNEAKITPCHSLQLDKFEAIAEIFISFTVPDQSDALGPKLVVATRSPKGCVAVYVSHCHPSGQSKLVKHEGVQDRITSLFYDESIESAFLTTFAADAPPRVLTMQGHRSVETSALKHLTERIQCAAQSPDGSSFAILTSAKGKYNNKIFTIKLSATKDPVVYRDPLEKFARERILQHEDHGIIAMPQANIIHVFWIQSSTMIFTTVSADNMENEPLDERDIRPLFEQCGGLSS